VLSIVKRLCSKAVPVDAIPAALQSKIRPLVKTGSIIDELFEADRDKKRDLTHATMTSCACLHEAGHLMMAEAAHIHVDFVRFPIIQNFYSPPAVAAANLPGVQPGVTIQALQDIVSFYLGGIFGELNIFDDNTLADVDLVYAFTYGCKSDITEVINSIRNSGAADQRMRALANQLNQSQQRSRDGADPSIFLQNFDYITLPEFQRFRRHAQRHRVIANELYRRWRAVDFGRLEWANPEFGHYNY
jgi:hypothetical protein